MFSFVTAVYQDEKIFKDAQAFKPERFLDDSGQFVRDEHVMAFGYGKRRCIGEKLARAEAFLFLATLIQNFKFSKVSEDQKLDMDPVSGLLFYPTPYDVKLEIRT